MQYNAFISYRRENGFLMAQIIHDKLAEKGITSFLDLEELRAGKFNEKLYEAIENSDNFILILPKGALDRCTSAEDWVRKEITAAVEMKKRIIPVLCDGFEWPREKYNVLPEVICSLEHFNAVKSTQDYLSAMIDRLVSFMDSVNIDTGNKDSIKESTEFISTEEYFTKGINDIVNLDMVDMAFHGGAEWHANIEKTDILYELAESGIHIRVLINPANVSEELAKHMRHKRKKYMSFDECIKRWKEFGEEFPDNVEVREVRIPLLRRYYSFHMKNERNDSVNVKYYTYANSRPDRNYQPIFYCESDYFRLYRDEFDYLWEQALKFDRGGTI
jgi:hypothetical protein